MLRVVLPLPAGCGGSPASPGLVCPGRTEGQTDVPRGSALRGNRETALGLRAVGGGKLLGCCNGSTRQSKTFLIYVHRNVSNQNTLR